MAAQGKIAHSQIVTKDPGGTPLVITDILSVSASGLLRDSIEITSNDSADNAKEFIPGLKDYGQLDLELNYSETMWKSLYDLWEAGITDTWRHTKKDGSYVSGSGFVLSINETHPDAAKTTMTVSIKATGRWTPTTA